MKQSDNVVGTVAVVFTKLANIRLEKTGFNLL